MLPSVDLVDFLSVEKADDQEYKLINIRGCNGSGKSTVPLRLLETDPLAFEVIWTSGKDLKKGRVAATVFPSYGFLALGAYRTKCGGLDNVGSTDDIKTLTRMFWNTPYHIIMEGVIPSTVFSTYVMLFNQARQELSQCRDVVIYNLLPPLQVCLDRVQQRNGGKEVKVDQIAGKWDMVSRNSKKFQQEGFTSLVVDNSVFDRSETLRNFFETIGVDCQEGVS